MSVIPYNLLRRLRELPEEPSDLATEAEVAAAIAAGGGGGGLVPALDLPITVPYDEALLLLVTGSGGPDGENSYLNDTRADVSAAQAIASFDLDAGAYAYDAMGVYDFGATYAEFAPTGLHLLAELTRRSDDTRVGWAGNNDPLGTSLFTASADLTHGDFNADMHPTPAVATTNGSGAIGGCFTLTEDVTVTLRVVNLGGYEQDPYTGDQAGRDIDVVALAVHIAGI